MAPLDLAAVQARARIALNRTLAWRATIARSGLVTPCRISFDTRPVHIDGLPSFVHIPRWLVTMQDGTDLRAGDVLAVQKPDGTLWATVGSYTVLETMNPTTISVSASGFAIQTSDANGDVPIFDATDTATFKSSQTSKELENVNVFLFDASRDLTVHDQTPGYQWGVMFDNRIAYPPLNGFAAPIVANDQIGVDRLLGSAGGTVRKVAISRPRPHPLLPVSIAYFSEPPQ